MPRKPPEFDLNPDELQELNQLVNAHKTAQQVVTRAKLLLALHKQVPLTHYAREQGLSTATITTWRNRWLESGDTGLSAIERLQDQYRSGAPAKFSTTVWCQIMAISCEDPKESERPISHWTAREVVEEAKKRGVVEEISVRRVQEFFKRNRVQTA